MKKVLLIYNPNAGKGKMKRSLSDVLELFHDNNWLVTVLPTRKARDAEELVAVYSEDYDLLVCAGGDGTINEAASGLMKLSPETRIPCGYIPAGTTNDFGTSLNISKDIIQAAQTVLSGSEFKHDIGSLNDKYFAYIAGFGAFTGISYDTPQITKSIFGRAAYFLNGFAHLMKITPVRMTITADKDTEITDEFLLGIICNTYSIGGIVNLKEDEAFLDDGKFEAIFIKNPSSPIQIQEIINDIVKQNYQSSSLYYFKASHIKCKSEIPQAWALDGEFGGDYTEVDIRNHPKAITFITEKFTQN